MSDETDSSPETPPTAARARKAATPRPKKAAKAATPVATEISPPAAAAVDSPPPVESPKSEVTPPAADAPAPIGGDWPESEGESAGGGAPGQSESGKRKRRRRKGKGQSSSGPNAGGPANDDAGPADFKSSDAPREQAPRPNPQPQQAPRPKIDPEHLAKMAWKIYLAEVSEEGVALIGDNDAKDLSRRCFRLAEIFIEEQSRRR